MFKRLIKPAIASVALAAAAVLVAAPASAGTALKHGKKIVQVNKWQQTPKQVKRLKKRAIDACLAQLEYDAYAAGYKDINVKRFTAKHVGPKRFKIYTKAKIYNGFNYQIDNYDCLVRKGQVIRKTLVQKANRKPIQFRRKYEGHGLQIAAFGGRAQIQAVHQTRDWPQKRVAKRKRAWPNS